tara:strand:- start:6 stop:905 length:900 start_codon:yes stop_codon:yes gene_type:complete
MQPIVEFLPVVSNRNHRKRAAMEKILQKLGELLDDPECAALLEELGVVRSKQCQTCRLIAKKTQEKPTTKRGACRAKWFEIREQMQELGCAECGWHGVDAMTVEHTDPSEKKRDANGNPVCLGEYAKWKTLGGPAAMQAEFDKPSVIPMCHICQAMQPTHNAMKPKLDPATLPEVSQYVDMAAYMKKYHLTETRKKMDYVDGKKLAIGECAECWMRVVPFGSAYAPGHSAYPHAFQWAHRSELDKGQGVAKIVNSRQSFDTAKPKLDREMGRSRMLCMNCGKVETDARQRAPGPSEEGN